MKLTLTLSQMLSEMDKVLADEIEGQDIRSGNSMLDRLRETLKNINEGAAQLGSKCFGLKPSTSDRQPSQVFFGEKFKPSVLQERAIQMALRSEICYIVGSLETDRTSTLAAIAFAYLLEGSTVLIAAQTDVAVDNAIMRLADLCTDTQNSAELQSGHLVRYEQESSQLASKYSDVHISTIVKRRGEDLRQQRGILEVSLNKVAVRLNAMKREHMLHIKRWQSDQHRLSTQCDAYMHELLSCEQRRITSLDAQLRDLTHKIDEAKHRTSTLSQELSLLTDRQTRLQREKEQHLVQRKDLTDQLARARQVGVLACLAEGLDLDFLSQQLENTKQQISNDTWILNGLQKRLSERYKAQAVTEKLIEEFISVYCVVEEQRNMLPADEQRLAWLQMKIKQYEQDVIRKAQILADIEQECSSLTTYKAHIEEKVAEIDRYLDNIEKRIMSEASVIATTVCNIYMSSDLHKYRFDVVILDEVSIESLPVVYVAASHAERSVVLMGDLQKTASIVSAKTPVAKNWLGTDSFIFKQIMLDEPVKESKTSIVPSPLARIDPCIDTGEAPCLFPQFPSGPWSSDMMWLVNVVVMWPQHKWIVIANTDRIRVNVPEEETVQDTQNADIVSPNVVSSVPMLYSPKMYPDPSHDREYESTPNASEDDRAFFDACKFYEQFSQDVCSAREQIIIFCPFLAILRINQILPTLIEKCQAGVKIFVITKPYKERSQIDPDEEAGSLLKDAGIKVIVESKMHEKLVIIDEEIVYSGSLNVLSHKDTSEIMERIKSPKDVKEIWEHLTHYSPAFRVIAKNCPQKLID